MGGWHVEPPIEGTIEVRSDLFPVEILQAIFKSSSSRLSIEIPVVQVLSSQMDINYDKTTYTLQFNAYDITIKENE